MKKKLTKIIAICTIVLATPQAWAENIVLINPFKVPENKLAESIQFWESARDFLSTQPGYVSTKLHHSLDENSEYQLINVAEWESKQSFDLAHKRMKSYFKSNQISPPKGLSNVPTLYTVIRK